MEVFASEYDGYLAQYEWPLYVLDALPMIGKVTKAVHFDSLLTIISHTRAIHAQISSDLSASELSKLLLEHTENANWLGGNAIPTRRDASSSYLGPCEGSGLGYVVTIAVYEATCFHTTISSSEIEEDGTA
jgi:hypothetical protein